MDFDVGMRILEILGVSGLISIAVTMIVNARRDRRSACQMNFESYSSRYSNLVGEILQKVDIDSEFDTTSGEQRALGVRFFMLLSEEEYLAGRKLIDTQIAAIWRDGLDFTMKHAFFRGAWLFAKSKFDFDGTFGDQVEEAVSRAVLQSDALLQAALPSRAQEAGETERLPNVRSHSFDARVLTSEE